MKSNIKKKLFLCYATTFLNFYPSIPPLSPDQLKTIGNKIWKNEGSQKKETLTWWNKGEPCASMGIGHFLWYPKNVEQNFSQTFPDLLVFLKKNGVALPSWLKKNPAHAYCPWHTHEDFFANFNHKKMQQLRDLLASTVDLQTQFIIKRSSAVLDDMLASMHEEGKKKHVKKQYYLMTQTANGMYALIDYHNFKGQGTNPKERYKNQGWGLLQVLERMNTNISDTVIIQHFANIATDLLEQRVNNAPKSNNETRFLAGWKNRIKTYVEPL